MTLDRQFDMTYHVQQYNISFCGAATPKWSHNDDKSTNSNQNPGRIFVIDGGQFHVFVKVYFSPYSQGQNRYSSNLIKMLS